MDRSTGCVWGFGGPPKDVGGLTIDLASPGVMMEHAGPRRGRRADPEDPPKKQICHIRKKERERAKARAKSKWERERNREN